MVVGILFMLAISLSVTVSMLALVRHHRKEPHHRVWEQLGRIGDLE
jgi:hypothetical protein